MSNPISTSNVGGTTNTTDVYGKYSIDNNKNASTTKTKSKDLGQDAFLQLMITQMKNQDPLNPQSNSEFVAQLAQFSQVEGLAKLNTNFTGFTNGFNSNQALQASSLVGRSVSVESDTSILSDKGIISGVVTVPSSTSDLKINIYDSKGTLATTIPVGSAAQGDLNFRFDGHNIEVDGNLLNWNSGATALKPDTYKFEVISTQAGKPQQLSTSLSANVNSVTVGADGKMILNLAGIGPVDISKVKQFN